MEALQEQAAALSDIFACRHGLIVNQRLPYWMHVTGKREWPTGKR
jgi:hypothetical protein